MIRFLSGSWFLYGFVPFLTIALAIYVRFASRRPEDRSLRKEDFAIGMELMLLSMLALLTIVATRAVQLSQADGAVKRAISTMTVVTKTSRGHLSSLQTAAQSDLTRLVSAVAILFGLILALWGTSFAVQQWGWRRRDELSLGVGVAIPIFLGFGGILLAISTGR